MDVFQVRWYLLRHERFQGKVGQALERLLFFTGSGRFCSKITSDQPKGLPGLMSRAEEKGKGKGIIQQWPSAGYRLSVVAENVYW